MSMLMRMASNRHQIKIGYNVTFYSGIRVTENIIFVQFLTENYNLDVIRKLMLSQQ